MSEGDSFRTNSNLFSKHYLEELLPETQTWRSVDEDALREAFDRLADLYDRRGDSLPERNESQLERHWIRPVLEEVLGHSMEVQPTLDVSQEVPDYAFFASDQAREAAHERKEEGGEFWETAIAVGDAKQWSVNLDKQETGRKKRNPSSQIDDYLDQTPPGVRWGILTNGKQWRIYCEQTSYKLDSYYEINLPELLNKPVDEAFEAFRYFYLFFRRQAFVEDDHGKNFLDRVLEGSNLFAKELGEDLRDNVYEALRVLAEGFLDFKDNDLDPDEDIQLVHDSALTFLYRIIFILYAESEGRELLPTDNDIYGDRYSLTNLKAEIADELDSGDPKYRDWQDDLWEQLEELFELIDKGSESFGIPPGDLSIPAYNGGLFHTDASAGARPENRFLSENTVGDEHLARVLDLLTRQANGGGKEFVDYSSLDIRHLGSIYEGLLEYRLNVAQEPMVAVRGDEGERWIRADEHDGQTVVERVEEGDVYLTTDKGQRKATGSYYTPEYIVQYIVQNTLGPLIEDIKQGLFEEHGAGGVGEDWADKFADRVFDLKILDPAMGSGHFLVDVVDYLAREIIRAQDRQREQAGGNHIEDSHDIHWARRQVAQRCIYGVDLNPMAVELAKVSLWLRTLAAEQPLAFLDHHLKSGNSIIGSEIRGLEHLKSNSSRTEETPNSSLRDFGLVHQGTMEALMQLHQELVQIENRDYADIQEMEEKHAEIVRDERRTRFGALANIHTAQDFGVDVPNNAFGQMIRAIEDNKIWQEVQEEEWFQEAQSLGAEKRFFHWDLEFPSIFFDSSGEPLQNPGFDVVLGNPPYVRIYRGKLDEEDVEYWRSEFEAAHMKFDLYVLFLELSLDLTKEGGRQSMIVPGKFTSSPYGQPLREKVLSEAEIDSILDVRDINVFEDVTVSTVVSVFHKRSQPQHGRFPIRSWTGDGTELKHRSDSSTYTDNEKAIFPLEQDLQDLELVQKIEQDTFPFSQVFYVNWGLRTGTDEKTEKYVVTETDDPKSKPMIRGENVADRYRLKPPEEYIIYEKDDLYNPMFEELFENPKIVFRKISGSGLMAVADEDGFYCFSTLIPCVNIRHVTDVERSGIPEMTPEASKYTDIYPFLAIVNSALIRWHYSNTVSDKLSVVPNHINNLPMPVLDIRPDEGHSELVRDLDSALTEGIVPNADDILDSDPSDDDLYRILSRLARNLMEWNNELEKLNLDFRDYLGNYREGKKLNELWAPASGVKDTILCETAEDRDKLRVERAVVDEADGTLRLSLTTRYKPPDSDNRSTDQWGYVETDAVPAMMFQDLDEEEAALVTHFVPMAVDAGDGFAGFRESATKTISPLDRLKAITLPDLDDVADDLERYLETKRRADEIDEKIEKTDELIDEIVYELYGLADEEIKIVEDAVADD